MDSLQMYTDVKRLTMPYQEVASQYEGLTPNTYAAGYACGYADAIKDVLKLIKIDPEPPKASGAPEWSDTLKTWMARAPKDAHGIPYVS